MTMFRRVTLTCVAVIVAAVAVVPAQQGTLSPAEMQRRRDLENELQSIAVVERKVMMPMRDGVRLATDIYRPKNATGPVPIVFVKTPYNFNYWDVRNRVPADMSTPIAAVKRGYAYVVPERARPLLLRRQLRHSRRADHRRLRRHRLADPAVVVERQGGHDRMFVDGRMAAGGRLARSSGLCGHERAGVRRRRRTRRPVLGAGQLVSRRRDADAVHHLDLRRNRTRCGRSSRWRRAARGPRRRVAAVRSGAADASGGLGQGALAPAGAGHHEGRARTARHLRRQDAGADRRRDGAADAQRSARGTRAGCGTTTCRSTCRACGSCRGTTSRSARTSRCSTTCARRRSRRSPNQQWAIIAPVAHCAYTRATENTIVGERSMGDARLDYNEIVYGFFDKFLKGDARTRARQAAEGHLLHDGAQQVADLRDVAARRRPADDASTCRAAARANSLYGDGVLDCRGPGSRYVRMPSSTTRSTR